MSRAQRQVDNIETVQVGNSSCLSWLAAVPSAIRLLLWYAPDLIFGRAIMDEDATNLGQHSRKTTPDAMRVAISPLLQPMERSNGIE